MKTKRARGFVAFIPAIGVEAWCRFEEGDQAQYRTASVIAWCVTRTGRTDALLLWRESVELASKAGAVSVEYRRTL